MIKAEKIIALAQYAPTAGEAIGDPNLIGRALARVCSETLVEELLERGYAKAVIISGLADALSNVMGESGSPRD